MRAIETGSSVGSSYVDALAYAVSSCVNRTVLASRGASWCRAVSQRLPGSCQDTSRCLRTTQRPALDQDRAAIDECHAKRDGSTGIYLRRTGLGPGVSSRG